MGNILSNSYFHFSVPSTQYAFIVVCLSAIQKAVGHSVTIPSVLSVPYVSILSLSSEPGKPL